MGESIIQKKSFELALKIIQRYCKVTQNFQINLKTILFNSKLKTQNYRNLCNLIFYLSCQSPI